MENLTLGPINLIHTLVAGRRVDELAALLNQQGDRFELSTSAEAATTWDRRVSGDNFAYVLFSLCFTQHALISCQHRLE